MDTTKKQFDTRNIKSFTPDEQANIKVFNDEMSRLSAQRGSQATAITADELNSTEAPLKLPAVNTNQSTSLADELVASSTSTSKILNEAERARSEALLAKDTARSEIDTLIGEITGVQASRSGLEEKAGVDTMATEIADLDTQIASKNVALRQSLKELESNPYGMTRDALTSEMERVKRIANNEIADLSIIQNAKQNKLQVARDIIDRKIENKLQPLKVKYDFLKTFYEDNRNDFSKADQRAFDTKIKQNERQYTEEKTKLKTLEDTKLKYLDIAGSLRKGNDVMLQIQRAETPEEVFSVVSKNNLISIEDQTKIKNLEKLNKEIKAMGVPAIVNPEATSASQALNVILGSTKLTPEQKKTLINSINTSGDNAFSVVKNQAKDIMGQTLATDLSKAETAKQQLERIDTLTKQFYANGGDTGIFSGNFEKTINKLGRTTDTNLVNLASSIALAMQEYRLAVTGTAASVQEDSRIDNIFPGITDGEILNNARTKALLGSFDSKIDASYRNVLGKGYDTLKQEETKVKSTEEVFITKIANFANQSPENKKRIEELSKIAPNATPEEIAKQLNI